MPNRPPDARRQGELAAVALTVVAYFVCYDVLNVRVAYVVATSVGWAAYVGNRLVRHPGCLQAYGLSRRGLARSALAVASCVALGAAGCAAVGFATGRLHVDRGLLLALALYPLWGVVQQFLVQAMVVRNLAGNVPPRALVGLAAILFGAIHLPDLALCAAIAVLGAAFTAIYLRWRNVWPLGIGHGLLGAVFYVWALGRDPWAEMFGAP